MWQWLQGSEAVDDQGFYSSKGETSPLNSPPSRFSNGTPYFAYMNIRYGSVGFVNPVDQSLYIYGGLTSGTHGGT